MKTKAPHSEASGGAIGATSEMRNGTAAFKEQSIRIDCEVIHICNGHMAKVRLPNGKVALGYLSGKLHRNYIRLLPGDIVTCEFSSYSWDKCRIIRRFNKQPEA